LGLDILFVITEFVITEFHCIVMFFNVKPPFYLSCINLIINVQWNPVQRHFYISWTILRHSKTLYFFLRNRVMIHTYCRKVIGLINWHYSKQNVSHRRDITVFFFLGESKGKEKLKYSKPIEHLCLYVYAGSQFFFKSKEEKIIPLHFVLFRKTTKEMGSRRF